MTLPSGWVALDARDRQVMQLVTPSLTIPFRDRDPQLLLYEPDRPWAASRGQVLISHWPLDRAAGYVARLDQQPATEEDGWRKIRDKVSIGGHTVARQRTWYPSGRTDDTDYESALVVLWVAPRPPVAVVMAGAFPFPTPDDEALIDDFFGAASREL